MQNYEKQIEENLTPWEIWQLERFGNILSKPPIEDEEDEHTLSTSEQAYFFNLENNAL